MADNLIPYEKFPEYWDPQPLKRLFEGMIIAGTIGIGVGIASDDRRITSASAASTGAGIVGQIILSLFRDRSVKTGRQ